MSPIIEVRLLMVARGEWHYRLLVNGGSIITADGDDCHPLAALALKAALVAFNAEREAQLARRASLKAVRFEPGEQGGAS